MGSRRTHEDRLDRLREVGLSDEHFEHFHSPIGLDLRGRTPEETAVAVAAEIIALRWGGSGSQLSRTAHDIRSASRETLPSSTQVGGYLNPTHAICGITW